MFPGDQTMLQFGIVIVDGDLRQQTFATVLGIQSDAASSHSAELTASVAASQNVLRRMHKGYRVCTVELHCR